MSDKKESKESKQAAMLRSAIRSERKASEAAKQKKRKAALKAEARKKFFSLKHNPLEGGPLSE